MIKLRFKGLTMSCEDLLLLKVWVCFRYANGSADCKGVCC